MESNEIHNFVLAHLSVKYLDVLSDLLSACYSSVYFSLLYINFHLFWFQRPVFSLTFYHYRNVFEQHSHPYVCISCTLISIFLLENIDLLTF